MHDFFKYHKENKGNKNDLHKPSIEKQKLENKKQM